MSMMGNEVQDKVNVVCICLAASGGVPRYRPLHGRGRKYNFSHQRSNKPLIIL